MLAVRLHASPGGYDGRHAGSVDRTGRGSGAGRAGLGGFQCDEECGQQGARRSYLLLRSSIQLERRINLGVALFSTKFEGERKNFRAGPGFPSQVKPIRWGGCDSFFSSSERLYQWSPAGEQYVPLTVRAIFDSRPDMHFWLNPCSQGNREFIPPLISALLQRVTK